MIPLDPALAKRLETYLHDIENFIRDDLGPQLVSARMDPDSGAIVVPDWQMPTGASYVELVNQGDYNLDCSGPDPDPNCGGPCTEYYWAESVNALADKTGAHHPFYFDAFPSRFACYHSEWEQLP